VTVYTHNVGPSGFGGGLVCNVNPSFVLLEPGTTLMRLVARVNSVGTVHAPTYAFRLDFSTVAGANRGSTGQYPCALGGTVEFYVGPFQGAEQWSLVCLASGTLSPSDTAAANVTHSAGCECSGGSDPELLVLVRHIDAAVYRTFPAG
jgi:hypothetical protein